MTPLVSVIVPVYNMSKYLRQCLDSILSQTLKEIEIICVDDGSTDDSLEILSEIAVKDSRVRVLQQENKGSGAARNYGIIEAKGEYIAFMDSDDWYPSDDVLEVLYKLCKEFKVSIAGGSLVLWDNKIREASSNYVFPSSGIMSYRDYQNPYFYQRFLYSHRMLQENQIVFPDYLRGQDPPFFVKSMATAHSFYVTTKPTYCYRFGYKKLNWNVRKANDYMKSIIDLLQLSIINQYSKLHLNALNDFQIHYSRCVNLKLDCNNPEFLALIGVANGCISPHTLKNSEPYPIIRHVLSPCSRILFRNSEGHRITRKISGLKSRVLSLCIDLFFLIQRKELFMTIYNKIHNL